MKPRVSFDKFLADDKSPVTQTFIDEMVSAVKRLTLDRWNDAIEKVPAVRAIFKVPQLDEVRKDFFYITTRCHLVTDEKQSMSLDVESQRRVEQCAQKSLMLACSMLLDVHGAIKPAIVKALQSRLLSAEGALVPDVLKEDLSDLVAYQKNPVEYTRDEMVFGLASGIPILLATPEYASGLLGFKAIEAQIESEPGERDIVAYRAMKKWKEELRKFLKAAVEFHKNKFSELLKALPHPHQKELRERILQDDQFHASVTFAEYVKYKTFTTISPPGSQGYQLMVETPDFALATTCETYFKKYMHEQVSKLEEILGQQKSKVTSQLDIIKREIDKLTTSEKADVKAIKQALKAIKRNTTDVGQRLQARFFKPEPGTTFANLQHQIKFMKKITKTMLIKLQRPVQEVLLESFLLPAHLQASTSVSVPVVEAKGTKVIASGVEVKAVAPARKLSKS